MRIMFYSDLRQKNTLLDDATPLGESMIHDDYVDISGNPTDGKSGRLTFDVVPNPTKTTDELRIRALFTKIESGIMTQDEIIEVLKLALVRELR